MHLKSLARRSAPFLFVLAGCAQAAAPAPVAPAPVSPTPCPEVAVAPVVPAAPSASAAPAPAASASASASAPVGPPVPPITKVTGGPRGVRACEFHESVDTYPRTCTVKVGDDGVLTVTAPGTPLNPKNGFSFRMGGGPEEFGVSGELEAFDICRGKFSGRMITLHEGAKKTYEVRFREHCMIVIR